MSILSFTEYPQSIGGQQAHTPAHSLWPAVPQMVAGTESVGWGHRADSPSCSCGWAGAARGRPLPLRSPVPPARCLHTGGWCCRKTRWLGFSYLCSTPTGFGPSNHLRSTAGTASVRKGKVKGVGPAFTSHKLSHQFLCQQEIRHLFQSDHSAARLACWQNYLQRELSMYLGNKMRKHLI